MDQVDEGEPVCMLGVMLHLLVAGTRFDLHQRKAHPGRLERNKD
jgi:cyanophycinase